MSITTRRLQRIQPGSILWGAYIEGSTYGPTYQNAPWDTQTWDLFEQHAGKKVSVMHYGVGSWWNEQFAPDVADRCVQRGAYPCIDMMIQPQDGVSLADIAAGTHDATLTTWAQSVKAWGKPLFFRWCGEMNGDWSVYGQEEIANPGVFVAAWRHMKNVTDGVGATNLTWVWCPNVDYGGPLSFLQVYPGHDFVDWTGLDGYNWGTSGSATWTGQWLSWHEVFKTSYDEIVALAPRKPLMIAETGCNEGGGSKAEWIIDALSVQLPKYFSQVQAMLWFNWPIFENGVTQQWPIESSPNAQAAFASAIASPYYIAGGASLSHTKQASGSKIPSS